MTTIKRTLFSDPGNVSTRMPSGGDNQNFAQWNFLLSVRRIGTDSCAVLDVWPAASEIIISASTYRVLFVLFYLYTEDMCGNNGT